MVVLRPAAPLLGLSRVVALGLPVHPPENEGAEIQNVTESVVNKVAQSVISLTNEDQRAVPRDPALYSSPCAIVPTRASNFHDIPSAMHDMDAACAAAGTLPNFDTKSSKFKGEMLSNFEILRFDAASNVCSAPVDAATGPGGMPADGKDHKMQHM